MADCFDPDCPTPLLLSMWQTHAMERADGIRSFYKMSNRGYASTKVLIVELTSLVRLKRNITRSRHHYCALPRGYVQLYNVDILLDRIKKYGSDSNVGYPDAVESPVTSSDVEVMSKIEKGTDSSAEPHTSLPLP